jgi:ketosteroid isomerase-like protein
VSTPPPAPSGGPEVSAADSVVRSYLASFAGGDPDAIAAHVAPGFVNEHASALGRGSVGADEYRARLPGFLASLPGLQYDVEAVIGAGERVAVQYRLTANSEGHPIDLRGVMVVDVDLAAGTITRRTDYWDSLTYLRQTGH